MLGRALCIRHVDAGSCNGCELEIHALNNPFYNLEGLGIRFVASPRHADLLLVTGPVSRHMEVALRRTYEATPDPKLVVALGDCGCTAASSARATRARAGLQRHPGRRRGAGLPADADAILEGILAAVQPTCGRTRRSSRAGRPEGLGSPTARRLRPHRLRYPRRRERGHAWDISTN